MSVSPHQRPPATWTADFEHEALRAMRFRNFFRRVALIAAVVALLATGTARAQEAAQHNNGFWDSVAKLFGFSPGAPNHFATPEPTPDQGPIAPGTFRLTDNIDPGRQYQTAALLKDGRVLIAGGVGEQGIGVLFSAEVYDPTKFKFEHTGRMTVARSVATATTLNDGKVLIVGGEYITPTGFTQLLASTDIYDPTTGTFSAGPVMSVARILHTATLLDNGKVLIAGGEDERGFAVSRAELFEPATGIFGLTGALAYPCYRQTATRLADGNALLAGGIDSTGYATDRAELYDPKTGKWTEVGKMSTQRKFHTATLLPNGDVLIAGGEDNWGHSLDSAELYNPATQKFTATGKMLLPREKATATLLTNGKVLIAGGFSDTSGVVAECELYDPVSGTFSRTGSMHQARENFTATRLSGDQVLVAGGFSFVLGQFGVLHSAELYEP